MIRLLYQLFFFSLFVLLFSGCHANPYRQGHELYRFNCESCHMEDGSGLEKLIPSLTSSGLFRSSPDCLICLIRYGLDKNEITGQQMPGNTKLNDVELANLVNYLRQEYASITVAVTTEEVNSCLAACKAEE
ncbi:MAG: cytochrome c [Saprospiraceae bacterium]